MNCKHCGRGMTKTLVRLRNRKTGKITEKYVYWCKVCDRASK